MDYKCYFQVSFIVSINVYEPGESDRCFSSLFYFIFYSLMFHYEVVENILKIQRLWKVEKSKYKSFFPPLPMLITSNNF